jgi:hypothetical protein
MLCGEVMNETEPKLSAQVYDAGKKLMPVLIFIGLVLIPLNPYWNQSLKTNGGWAFLLITIYYSAIIFGIGFIAASGNVLSILIDRRNMVSLSKLQMVLWTILVVSGFVAIAASKAAFEIPDPLDIGIPGTVWALMGISTAALIGSPLIKNENYKDKNSGSTALDANKQETKGSEVMNKDIKDASILDIFRGEETGNISLPDLGKIQMLLFTLIVWVAYATLIYQTLSGMDNKHSEIANLVANATKPALMDSAMTELHKMTDFPDISEGMTALLGISNAGYLAYKGIDRKETEHKT